MKQNRSFSHKKYKLETWNALRVVGPARPGPQFSGRPERAKIGPKFRAGPQILGPTRTGQPVAGQTNGPS